MPGIDDALRPVIAITQARIGSTRLPAKVLRNLCGKPMLWWHLTRLARAEMLDGIMVATTNELGVDQIAEIAQSLGIPVFHGDETDVLARYAGAARMASARTIVRITSDCPLIDPNLIDTTIESFGSTMPDCRYVALSADHYPRGLDCEVFSAAALFEAASCTADPADREHVTPFLRREARFNARWLFPDAPITAQRWCVDTPEDYALVSRVIEAIGDYNFNWRDVLALIDAHPDWLSLNAHVRQKNLDIIPSIS